MARTHFFRWHQNWKYLSLAVVTAGSLSLFATGCGDDEVANGGSGGQPGTSADWSEVSRRARCEAGGDSACVNGRFVVNEDGEFFFQNTSRSGQLTQDQLARLDTAADAVVDDLNQDLTCTAQTSETPLVASESVAVTPQSGTASVTVLEVQDQQDRVCFRGNEDDARQLNGVLTDLMRTYAPAPGDQDGSGDGAGYDPCANKMCGDSCEVCPPNDPDCFETAVLKFCTSAGECQAGEPSCQMPESGPTSSPSPTATQ